MDAAIRLETELRHAVIDRLIAASLRDGTPAREATLERWRSAGRAPVQGEAEKTALGE
jgi:hypothetical protein